MANLFEAMNYDIQPYHKQSRVNRKVYKPSTPHKNIITTINAERYLRCELYVPAISQHNNKFSHPMQNFKLCINHKTRENCFCLDNKNLKCILDDLMMFNQCSDLFFHSIAALILFFGFSFVLSLRHPFDCCPQPYQLNLFSRRSFSLIFFILLFEELVCARQISSKQINTLSALHSLLK